MRNETVALVLDSQYGDQLESLATKMPVWIVGSEINSQTVERVWKSLPGASVTRFNASPSMGEPQEFLSLLETIELHHGPYSSKEPVKAVRVLGFPLSDELRIALVGYGCMVRTEAEGFHVELRSRATEELS
jgi:hypothetical protein